jgi:phosphate transport system protein
MNRGTTLLKPTGATMNQEHVTSVLDKELSDLRQSILIMGGKVEWMIGNSIKALIERDITLAERTIAYDHEVNSAEIAIDERCLEILALRHPTGRDLRFITQALKIVTDLERIGDKCSNIAKRALKLSENPPTIPYGDIYQMAQWAQMMLKEALDAFVNYDPILAAKVCKDDSLMNDLNDNTQRELLAYMTENPTMIANSLKMNYVSKSLERVADHATNIAEMVIFMVQGKNVRHTKITD